MSRHHCKYFGCQCSSARCSRLLSERLTLFGIRSAEIMFIPTPDQHRGHRGHRGISEFSFVSFVSFVSNQRFSSGPFPVEFGSSLLAINLQCTLLAHRIRPLKDPVLPRG